MKITIHIKEKLNSVINYMNVQGYRLYITIESFARIHRNLLEHYDKFDFIISELHV